MGARIGRLDRSWRRAGRPSAVAAGATAIAWVRRSADRRGAAAERLRAEIRVFPSESAAGYDLERWLAGRWRGAPAWQPAPCPELGEGVWLADHQVPGMPARVELARGVVRATLLAESPALAQAAAAWLIESL